MIPWFLLILTVVFAYLTYDAISLAVPRNALQYSVIAKGMGQDLSHLPLSEQEELKRYSNRYGLGNLNHTVWLFAILTISFATATIFAFLG